MPEARVCRHGATFFGPSSRRLRPEDVGVGTDPTIRLHFLIRFLEVVIATVQNVSVPSRPPLSCRTSPPRGGRLAVALAFATRQRCKRSEAPDAADLPPSGGDGRQARG